MKTISLTNEETAQFCARLGLLLRSGARQDEALELIALDPGAELRAAAENARTYMESGLGLDAALEKTGAFPRYMTQMLGIGLISGSLDGVAGSLAEHYRREAELESALRRTVLAPAALALTIAAVMLVLMDRVLPIFQRSFAQLGLSLSPAARLLLGLGQFSRHIAAALALVLAAMALLALWISKTEKGRHTGKKLLSGAFARSGAGQELCRSRVAAVLGLMLGSGIAPGECLDRAGQLVHPSPVGERLAACRGDMDELGLGRALERSGVFSPMDSALISAAFRAGQGESALAELADRCAARAGEAMERTMDKSELILVLALCAAVGFVLLSVMLPLLGAMAGLGAAL